ncbi:hypothetical protein BASA62_003420 [Batrachochytrium salamandrivorans]|nr:hypothetical protein BASA62_003420 [Batrachochytrium salamandrivorans]
MRSTQWERNYSFVRQVEWVAVSRNLNEECAFTVLSPREANALLLDFSKLSTESHVALFQFAVRVRRIQQSSLFEDARLVLPAGSWMAKADEFKPRINRWRRLALFSCFSPTAQLEQRFGRHRRGALDEDVLERCCGQRVCGEQH